MSSSSKMLGRRLRPVVVSGPAQFERPDSQLVSAAQIYEPACQAWFARIGLGLTMDRKSWEYAFILNAIKTYAATGSGARGLGFGCGKEFITSLLAADGTVILATDYIAEDVEAHGWEARGLDDLYFEQYIDRPDFDERVSFRNLDMNAIDTDLRDFDFCWSTGSLEHIGGAANGLAFVEKAMDVLKPGGIAVHTTEFTISSEIVGQDYPELSFYCRRDIEALATRLLAVGHKIVLNFDRGTTVADTHVDLPPYHSGQTLCAHFSSHVITSIGLIIEKGE